MATGKRLPGEAEENSAEGLQGRVSSRVHRPLQRSFHAAKGQTGADAPDLHKEEDDQHSLVALENKMADLLAEEELKIQNVVSTKTICAAGKDTVTHDECRACARSGKQTCSFDYTVICSMLSDKIRYGVHVTDLVGCLRRTVYDKTYDEAEPIQSCLYRWYGTAMHQYLEQDLAGIEFEKEVKALGLEGSIDVFYLEEGRIIDYKTTRWINMGRLPYGSHVTQVNIYAAMLREMGHTVNSAAIQMLDLTGPSKCRKCKVPFAPDANGILVCPICHVSYMNSHTGAALVEVPLQPHEDVVRFIEKRRPVIVEALQTGISPEPNTSYLCDYCKHQPRCQTDEGRGTKPVA